MASELTLELPDVRKWPKSHRDLLRDLCAGGFIARPASSGSVLLTPPDGSPSKRVSPKSDLKELQSWQLRVLRGTAAPPSTVIDLTESEPAVSARTRKPPKPVTATLSLDDHDHSPAIESALGKIDKDEQMPFLMTLIRQASEQVGFTKSESVLLSYFVATVDKWRQDGEYAAHQADKEAAELTRLYEQERDAALAERDALQAALDQASHKNAALQERARASEREREEALQRAESAEGKLRQLRSALDL